MLILFDTKACAFLTQLFLKKNRKCGAGTEPKCIMSVFADLHEKKKEFFVFKKLFFLTQKRESAASAMGQREHFLFFQNSYIQKHTWHNNCYILNVRNYTKPNQKRYNYERTIYFRFTF